MNGPIIVATQKWLERAVIGLELCPFARAPYVAGQVHFAVSDATDTEQLLADLVREMRALVALDAAIRETSLLIHPKVLQDFLDYNDFLDVADAALEKLGLADALQVASFHPQYQFAGSASEDISNYSNRSPYPMVQLLRNASIERAVQSIGDTSIIYEKNIAVLQGLGHVGWSRLFMKN